MKFLLLIVSALMLAACASQPKTILKVKSLEDIPRIAQEYANSLAQLKLGMNKSQVVSLFPNIERECYESGRCHFTVFDERIVQIDRRLQDLDLLTGGLMSVLALTCLLADESCKEAVAAAINVGVASAIASEQITNGSISGSTTVASAVILNRGYLGTPEDNRYSHQYSKDDLTGTFTLIQWINIEFVDGRVTEWAVNEPLNQFKPKTYKNELPTLEDALGLDN